MTPECPKCGDMQIEEVITGRRREYYGPTCSHSWAVPPTQSPASPQQVPIARWAGDAMKPTPRVKRPPPPPKNVPPRDCPHCPTTHQGVKGYLACAVCGTLSVVV